MSLRQEKLIEINATKKDKGPKEGGNPLVNTHTSRTGEICNRGAENEGANTTHTIAVCKKYDANLIYLQAFHASCDGKEKRTRGVPILKGILTLRLLKL